MERLEHITNGDGLETTTPATSKELLTRLEHGLLDVLRGVATLQTLLHDDFRDLGEMKSSKRYLGLRYVADALERQTGATMHLLTERPDRAIGNPFCHA